MSSPDTSISLLERLRLHGDAASWRRLVDLYCPFIQDWLRRQGVQACDADDLTQEVLRVVVREIPQFQHDLRRGAFRRWLRTISLNQLRNFWRACRPVLRAAANLDQLEDPDSDLSRLWDEEHDRHVVRRLLEIIENDFEPATWQAFRLQVLEGMPTDEIAERLGLSVNAVRIAKSRVLSRFRQEINGLID